jgi:XTP/dITP diphosphohydrolase
VLFVTTNKGKLAEVMGIAARFGIPMLGIDQVLKSKGLSQPDVPETGLTYEENALLKARSYAAWAGCATVSDDSGLELDRLWGLPGVYTAHYGIERLFSQLTKGGEYRARFSCCMALAEPGGRTVTVTAKLDGLFVVPKSEGVAVVESSLPFSSFFYPLNESSSLSLLMRQKAGYLSHRTKALVKLFEVVR